MQGLIESELGAQRREFLRGCLRAKNRHGRITWEEFLHGKDDQRDPPQHWESGQEASDDVAYHRRLCPFCASAASAWGSQKVMSIARYISIAVVSAVWACSCWSTVVYSIPRPRWQWAWSGRMPSSSARARAWR